MTVNYLTRSMIYGPLLILRRISEHRLGQLCAGTSSLVLTYDDGPSPDLTPPLLDLLASHNAKATFFPQGSRAEKHPRLLDRALAEGHEIGCHTYQHVHPWRSGARAASRDMERGYEVMAPWVASSGPFRPPYGKATLKMMLAARARDARLAWWTVDAGDTNSPPLPRPESTLQRLRETGGGVVLMHDHYRRGSSDSDLRADYILKTTAMLLETAPSEGWTIRGLADLYRTVET